MNYYRTRSLRGKKPVNTNTEFTIMRANSIIKSNWLTCTKYMFNIQFMIFRRYVNFRQPHWISSAAKHHSANVHSSHETRMYKLISNPFAYVCHLSAINCTLMLKYSCCYGKCVLKICWGVSSWFLSCHSIKFHFTNIMLIEFKWENERFSLCKSVNRTINTSAHTTRHILFFKQRRAQIRCESHQFNLHITTDNNSYYNFSV